MFRFGFKSGRGRLPRQDLLIYLARPNSDEYLIGEDTETGEDTYIWGYILPDDSDIRDATGWVTGTANVFYDAAGAPVVALATEIDRATLPFNVVWHLTSESQQTGRLAIYDTAATSATIDKARSVMRDDSIDHLFFGNAGIWYDPQDLATMFQDSAGTLPVYRPGSGAVDPPVGLLLDKSQGLELGPELAGTAAITGTAGYASYAAELNLFECRRDANGVGGVRIDVQSNTQYLLTLKTFIHRDYPAYTKFVNFPNSANGASLTGSAYVDGGTKTLIVITNGTPVYPTSAFLNLPNVNCAFGVEILSIREIKGYHAYQSTTTARPTLSGRYNLLTATDTLSTQSVTTAATDYTLRFEGTGTITLSGTATGTYTAGTHTITCTAGTLTCTVSGTVTNADLRRVTGQVLPVYQAVVNANTYDTAGFPLFLKRDLVDDKLYLVVPAGGISGTRIIGSTEYVRASTDALTAGTSDFLPKPLSGAYGITQYLQFNNLLSPKELSYATDLALNRTRETDTAEFPGDSLILRTGATVETIGGTTVLRSSVPTNANSTVQQVKGSGFAGAGSATVTGLLTTDTITATGDAPTCTVDGALTFPGPDCWDVYVHRGGALWAYWPGINVGATFELDASGNGHTLYLTDTAITERLDGSGSNHANEAGFTVADGTQYGDDTGTERIPLGYRIPVSVSSGESCAWRFTPDEMVTGTEVISWWGDSLTLGAAPYLRSFRGGIINRGVGGETSTQIKNRFALSKVYSNIEIIWAGNNNPGEIQQVLSDISEMATSSVSNYLVVGLLINAVHAGGSATKDAVLSINSTLAATYGEKFINILDYLKTQYDPENPQDVIDVGNGITPSSLRSDDVHLNATGYTLVAEAVNSKLIELGYCSSVDNSLSTTGNCLNATLADGAFIISVQNPPGCPEYDNTVIIQNGGSAALGHINGKIIAITAGSIFDLKLIFTDGTVVTFPCNERIGSTIYGYSQDGDIYLGHLASGGMSILDVWAWSQQVYHHAARYGNGVILTGQLGPEKHYNVSDRDFSSDTGNWSKGAGWAIAGGVATHTGSTGTSIVFGALSIKGATIRTNFDIVTHGSGITGLSGGTVDGGFYKKSPGSYTKDYQLKGVNLSLYSTSDASVDNVSSAEIYQGAGVVPANPYLPGTDCRGDLI